MSVPIGAQLSVVQPGEGDVAPIPNFGAVFKLTSATTGGLVAIVEHQADRPQPISDEAARQSASVMAHPQMGWHAFNWALRARVPDPGVVD